MKITTIKCKKCKKEIPTNSKFCCWCGKKIEKKSEKRADGRYEKSITINGKRKTFYGKTKAELNKKILLFQQEVEESQNVEIVLDDYENKYLPTLVPTTQKNYKPALKLMREELTGIPISAIKPIDIQRLIDSLPQSFTKKTKSNYKSTISSVFSFAIRESKYGIDNNPCEYTKCKGKPSTPRRIATDEEIKIICENTDAYYGLFAFFTLMTGCRRAELMALRYEDIDFKNDVIKIKRSTTWENSKPIFKSPKSDAGYREIFLLPQLKEKIPKNKKGLIFPSLSGELMKEGQYRKIWNRYSKEVGLTAYATENNIPRLTAHCLRHSYATLLNEASIDLKERMALLGHSDERMTNLVYTSISERKRQKDYKKIADGFDKQLNEIQNEYN